MASKQKRKASRRKGRSGAGTHKSSKSKASRLSARTQKARVRGLNAINRARRGKSKTLASAAKAEGTSVRTIRRLLPAALLQDRPGTRIHVTASDRYSQKVRIISTFGYLEVTARGSRQRELAGRHLSTVKRVLKKEEPASALEQFRGKKVGGQDLVVDFDLLFILVQADVLEGLDLYVTPETTSG